MNWVGLLVVVHVLVALVIIGLVLLQHGKGADMGSGFGGGASGSLFGATGSANFLSRTTGVLAAVFFVLSLALTYVASNRPVEAGGGGVMDAARQKQQEPQKSVPAPSQQPAQDKPAAQPEPAAPAQGATPAETPKDKQVPQ